MVRIRTALAHAGISEARYVADCGPVLDDPVDAVVVEDLAWFDWQVTAGWAKSDSERAFFS